MVKCAKRPDPFLLVGGVWERLPEPGFVNLLRSPGIDSQPGGPVRQPYLSYRPARLHRLVESLLGYLNVYKYGLWWYHQLWLQFFCDLSVSMHSLQVLLSLISVLSLISTSSVPYVRDVCYDYCGGWHGEICLWLKCTQPSYNKKILFPPNHNVSKKYRKRTCWSMYRYFHCKSFILTNFVDESWLNKFHG